MVSRVIVIRWLVHWYLTDAPPSVHVWHKAVLWWVQPQYRSLDAPGSPQNTWGSVGILLKKKRLWRQAIDLNLPKGVKAWRESPLRSEGSPMQRYTPDRSVTQQLERCTNTMIDALRLTLSLACIYGGGGGGGGGGVHCVGSTTVIIYWGKGSASVVFGYIVLYLIIFYSYNSTCKKNEIWC